MAKDLAAKLIPAYAQIELFARELSGLTLRRYQRLVADTIIQSVLHSLGLSIVVIFPRQSGKNELQAQIEAICWGCICSETQKSSRSRQPGSRRARTQCAGWKVCCRATNCSGTAGRKNRVISTGSVRPGSSFSPDPQPLTL